MQKLHILQETARATAQSSINYKKSGDVCEVYSPCRAKDYSVSDAVKIKKTTFEVVNKAEGKLYRKATVKEVKKIIKQLVNQYL